MAFSQTTFTVIGLLFAVFAESHAAAVQGGTGATNCTAALQFSQSYAAAAAAAAAAANASVTLAVSANAEAEALAKASAAALASVHALATVEQASNHCVIGVAFSGAESIANSLGTAEASAKAAADAFASAWTSAKAAAIAQGRAVASFCGCEETVDKDWKAAQTALSIVEASASQYQDAMAKSEDKRHQVALILVKVAARASEVAKPQCATCKPGETSFSSFQKAGNGGVTKASGFSHSSGGGSTFSSIWHN
jgi:trimeric autotransporter adhesin